MVDGEKGYIVEYKTDADPDDEFTNVGINGRWRKRIYQRIYETNDWQISPRIQQSLLHWGYMVNKNDFEQWKILNNK